MREELEPCQAENPYQYSPLNDENFEIRLMKILPSKKRSSEVRILLETVSFSTDWETTDSDSSTSTHGPEIQDFGLHFQALSYTWGSPAYVLVGRSSPRTIQITQNLADALPYLRYADRPRVIWVDAICVNQQDLEERSQQVKRMADIYSRATRVVVWLGKETANTALAVRTIEWISANITVDWNLLQIVPDTSSIERTEWSNHHREIPWTQEENRAVLNLLNRDWFRRLWIWQEVGLAKNVSMLCRSRSFSFGCLRDAVFAVHIKPKFKITSELLSLAQRHVLFCLCGNNRGLKLNILLEQSRHSICSDPRDRLYALFSLINNDEKHLKIPPDYSRRCVEIYSDFTRHYIKCQPGLFILMTYENDEEHLSSKPFPSWVPDWSSARETQRLVTHLAAGFSRSHVSFLEDSIMRVSGRTLSTVIFVETFKILENAYLSDLEDELLRVVKTLGIQELLLDPSQGREQKDACRILCGGVHKTLYIPRNEDCPDLDLAQAWLRTALLRKKDDRAPRRSQSTKYFLDSFGAHCLHWCIFKCSDGTLGIGPKATKPGDIIAARSRLQCTDSMPEEYIN